jgi:tRNA-dihydrouridine synthase B
MNNREPYERFELAINDTVVRTPVAIASMAGVVDARYVLERAEHIGAAFIGGYSIDRPAIEASREMAAGGRKEFLPDDPIEELARQLALLKGSGLLIGLNLRAQSADAYRTAAETLGDGAIYEIDAHCRQAPMIAARAGEYLVSHKEQLCGMIQALKEVDVTVSVKFRAGVSPDDRAFSCALWEAGADIIHVDLMDFGYQKCRQIRNASPVFLIANNSIHTFDRAMDVFSHGADMISLARRSDMQTLAGLDAAITRYTDEYGWYNAPKQLCRGGDLRALAFCCMPVKDCALIPALARLGISADEYLTIKRQAVAGTDLEPGPMTCFGSLAWCCKATSPCMLRDTCLQQMGLSRREYMRQKHHLSQKIFSSIFHDMRGDDTC